MRALTPSEVTGLAAKTLNLPSHVAALDSTEALAALIRRAAAFLCPTNRRTIREAVLASLRGLIADKGQTGQLVDEVLEALLAYGDLLELPPREENNTGSLLYLAPPSFVRRASGTVFLLGIAPDGASILPETLQQRIAVAGHTRRLHPASGEDLPHLLSHLGLNELPESLWRRRPRIGSAEELVQQYGDRLSRSEHRGELEGLLVLDSTRDVTYYNGRWVAPKKQSGRFIARREQRYGNPLWSYVELSDGAPTRLTDIPAEDGFSGADRAWHLQMALDHIRGAPQRFAAAPDGDQIVLRFYSPVPKWAQRRWELLGERLTLKGCLFAYQIPSVEYPQERELLVHKLWLQESK